MLQSEQHFPLAQGAVHPILIAANKTYFSFFAENLFKLKRMFFFLHKYILLRYGFKMLLHMYTVLITVNKGLAIISSRKCKSDAPVVWIQAVTSQHGSRVSPKGDEFHLMAC